MSIGTYLLELDRWNVKNDGTDAVNTSVGINNALLWSSQQNFTEVILPKGTYLIDENNPIQPQSFMTLNLGGSTLRIRDNNLPKYAIVLYNNSKQYSKITNGRIEGDRYTHNYSSGGTHEFGVGVELRYGGRYITIENLEILNTTGDAILAITSFGGIGGGFPTIAGNLELGGINLSDGQLNVNSNRIRSKIKIPMVTQIVNTGYFGLYGDSYGGIGSDITTDIYDVVFYKNDDTFLSSKTDLHFFDEIEVPTGASYAKFVLHQGTVPSINGTTIMIRTPEFPKNVYIEKCNLHHCRRLGIAIAGVKHFYVRGCEIHNISGTAPAGAIDVEDGYDLNQHIYIDGNNIYENNSYNIIVVAGKYINITNNKIHSGIFSINSSVDKAIVKNNYFIHSGPRLEGDTQFSDNHLLHSRLLLLGNSDAILDSCFFHNSPLNIGKTKAYVAQINNCQFLYDNDFSTTNENPGSPLIFSSNPQKISNCTFEGSGKEAFTVVPADSHDWILSNVSFINTKTSDNRILRLPPGTFIGCKFINSGMIGELSNGINVRYEFNQCYFEWASYHLFYMGPSKKIDFFKVSNCYFYNNSGSGSSFFIKGTWGRLEFDSNIFNFPGGTNTPMVDIQNTTIADSLSLARNYFISNAAMIGVNAEKSPNIPLIFKDNEVKKVQIKLHDTHIKLNNFIDGVLDPYYLKASEPTIGYYKLGQEIKNSNPMPGGYIGWIVTKEGTANNNPWRANKSYSVNTFVNANGFVYRSATTGTSGTTAPSHTSGSAIDGSVTWEYIGVMAIFKPYGLISS